MAWQAYVEQLLSGIDGQHLAAAAIIGQDGAVRAQSSNFPEVKPEEISAVMKNFDEPGSLEPTGLHLGGTKYMVIQGDSGSVIRAKKGAGGVTIKKTNLSIVIGIYEAPMHAAQCNVVVERLGDYLVEQSVRRLHLDAGSGIQAVEPGAFEMLHMERRNLFEITCRENDRTGL